MKAHTMLLPNLHSDHETILHTCKAVTNGPVTWRGISLLDLGGVLNLWKNQDPLIPWPKCENLAEESPQNWREILKLYLRELLWEGCLTSPRTMTGLPKV